MGRRRTEDPNRISLGEFWLEPRAERSEWVIAWYDDIARTRRRKSTGIEYGGEAIPPIEAQRALAEHFSGIPAPTEPQPIDTVTVAKLLDIWMNDEDEMARLGDPGRYAISVKHLLRFFDHERAAGQFTGAVMVSDVKSAFVLRFIKFRKAEGVGGHTISRDIAALRRALVYSWKEEHIPSAPFVRDVDPKDKAKPRALIYTMEQVAGILEAAYRLDERHHVLLYTMIQMSTCGRSEAILDLWSHQLERGLIYFLDPDRDQTSKRRSIVPIAPTLAPWLEGIDGKVIKYRALLAERKWIDPEIPEYFERDCYDLGKAFDACLIEAGLSRPVLDRQGKPALHPVRTKLGETIARPKLRGNGTPNTLRHTIITEMHRRGVAEAQIDAASGHLGEGTNKRNYRHLRPDYLAELIAAIEDYWNEMKHYTTVHLRSHNGPTVVSMAAARAGRRIKS